MKLKTSGTLALIALVESQRLVRAGSSRLEGITDIINGASSSVSCSIVIF